jgi:hypothetical protein
MTAVAYPNRSHPRLSDVVPRSAVRVVALVFAACIIFAAGVAAATRLAGVVTQPTQSQQPAVTASTSR